MELIRNSFGVALYCTARAEGKVMCAGLTTSTAGTSSYSMLVMRMAAAALRPPLPASRIS
jgi:hypothetical protein